MTRSGDLQGPSSRAPVDDREHQFQDPGQVAVVNNLTAYVGPLWIHAGGQGGRTIADPLLKGADKFVLGQILQQLGGTTRMRASRRAGSSSGWREAGKQISLYGSGF
ncbi:hypothetical protein ACFRAO_12005 [Streptomyces sp. NPDC056656]|uniref:hypothetical protein n=1 Tax=Streptomyces sp. NPDC056656 TaxID=3345895 RepID=UPI0036AFB9EE